CAPLSATAQINPFSVGGPDTLHTIPPHPDSLKHLKDTSKAAKGVDTLVTYSSADSIMYSLRTRTMSLYTKSQIAYRQMRLTSERIDINWNTSEMHAFGVTDSSRDTTRPSKNRMRGLPVMKDGAEEYHGSTLSYNFKTQKGRINVANTQTDQGYY